MPAWTHTANQTAMQDCLIELVYLGTTMKGYQALRFKLHNFNEMLYNVSHLYNY